MPGADAAAVFFTTLNGLQPCLTFTMELHVGNKIPFIGIEIVKNGTKLETVKFRENQQTGFVALTLPQSHR